MSESKFHNEFAEQPSAAETETIESGVWRPGIMKKFRSQVGCGASTKELKRIIGREDGKVRITAKPDRFDLPFGRRDREEKVQDLAAGRIITELLERVDSEADPHNIIKTKLTHGKDVVVVDQEYIKGEPKNLARMEADGMVTNLDGVPLMVAAADCAPVYFYDPKNKAIGLCHAGWRGIAKGISGAVIEKMSSNYGSQLQDMVVAVGPYADGKNYEVGESVYAEFLNARDAEGNNMFDEEFLQTCFQRQENGKFLFDSGIAIRNFLIRLGLKPENIEVSNFSTITNNDLFSSERKEGQTERDSFINIITLRRQF